MATVVVAPTQDQIFQVVGNYLLTGLPDSYDIRQGQIGRVSEPSVKDYAVMWLTSQARLSTNIDDYVDGVFTGTITGVTMTIDEVDPNYTQPLVVGHQIFGVGIVGTCKITRQVSGTPGGVGVYTVTPGQTFGPGLIAAGVETFEQATQVILQIDVHGPLSGNYTPIITTLFRDERAVLYFDENLPAVSPLFTSDPKQLPFQNAEQGWEDRWVIEANLEVNYTVSLPQQFFIEAVTEIINVDAVYPPQE